MHMLCKKGLAFSLCHIYWLQTDETVVLNLTEIECSTVQLHYARDTTLGSAPELSLPSLLSGE